MLAYRGIYLEQVSLPDPDHFLACWKGVALLFSFPSVAILSPTQAKNETRQVNLRWAQPSLVCQAVLLPRLTFSPLHSNHSYAICIGISSFPFPWNETVVLCEECGRCDPNVLKTNLFLSFFLSWSKDIWNQKGRPFQTKWAFSTTWTSWSLSSPGWPDMVSMFLEIMYFNCLPHILLLVCWLKEMIFFSRGGRWISGYLLHQWVDWKEPAPICSYLQQVIASMLGLAL